jgi:hypothetical protein
LPRGYENVAKAVGELFAIKGQADVSEAKSESFISNDTSGLSKALADLFVVQGNTIISSPKPWNANHNLNC